MVILTLVVILLNPVNNTLKATEHSIPYLTIEECEAAKKALVPEKSGVNLGSGIVSITSCSVDLS